MGLPVLLRLGLLIQEKTPVEGSGASSFAPMPTTERREE